MADLTKDEVREWFKEDDRGTKRKQINSLTIWLEQVNYTIEHLEEGFNSGRVVVRHLGETYTLKELGEFQQEADVYKSMLTDLKK